MGVSMSWIDDFGIDVECLIETTRRQEYYDNLSNEEIAFELKSVMKYVKEEYLEMVRNITERALSGKSLSEKQRNVMINTLVNIEEVW
jgi:hypothetical protein